MDLKDYQIKEKESQEFMDLFYKSKGWTFNRESACKEYDIIIEECKVEEKFRYNDYNDFLIEIIQDIISFNKGWYYETKAKKIFYIINDQKLYSIDWDKFKNWFKLEYKNIKFRPIISIMGWGLTINIAIKWDEIPKKYYKIFNLFE